MALKGLVTRKEIWVPTSRGWALAFVVLVIGVGGFLYGVHPFLAPNESNGQGVLVVEGWLSDKDLALAMPLLKNDSYDTIITIGGVLDDGSIYKKLFPKQNTWAHVVAKQIVDLGVASDRVWPVPRPSTQLDRTYLSATLVKQWLEQHTHSSRMVDVLSVGVHARRSWLLFDIALGQDFQVGIIALTDRHYNEAFWWRSSEGIKTVIKELVGYLYAKFLFWP